MSRFITGRLIVYVCIPLTIFSFLLIEANYFLIKDHLPGFRTAPELLKENIQVYLASNLPHRKASLSRAYVTLYMLNTLDIEAGNLSKQSAPASLIPSSYCLNSTAWDYSDPIILNVNPILKARTQVLQI